MARKPDRRTAIVLYAVEVQAQLRELRRETAPMYEAALRSGNHAVLAETHALAESLRISQKIARRVAGMADVICADGIAQPGHGKAA